MAEIVFAAPIIEWRGPAPFYFVPVPLEHAPALRQAARLASYGWGVVPVEALIGQTDFGTSLIPREGGYVLPLKRVVRLAAGVAAGEIVRVRLRVFAAGASYVGKCASPKPKPLVRRARL